VEKEKRKEMLEESIEIENVENIIDKENKVNERFNIDK